MPADNAIDTRSDGELRSRHPDRAIARIATRQHGVIARRQLVNIGLRSGAIDRRVESRRLLPLHRGVYAVGHGRLAVHGRWMAAVLAGPAGTVLSHRDAAALWDVRRVSDGLIEVTAPPGAHHVPGLRRYQRALPADEVTVRDGIPVTEATRTLMDLASVLTCQEVERAMNEAEVRRRWSGPSLPVLLDRYRGRRGIACIRSLVAQDALAAPTRSELEFRFLALLRAHGFREPSVNAGVRVADSWYEVDCVWRDHRLIVELDGHAVHSTRLAFERDRARDRGLQVAGWRVLRVTWRQLLKEPAAIVADLRALVGQTR